MSLTRVAASLAALVLFAGAASAADFPKGTISTELGGQEWTIRYEDGGRFAVSAGGDVVAEGQYKAAGDEIEMTDEKGSRANPGKTGKYTWKREGKSITFTKVDDEVKGRVGALTNGTWTLKD
jgi:hypothetical protein